MFRNNPPKLCIECKNFKPSTATTLSECWAYSNVSCEEMKSPIEINRNHDCQWWQPKEEDTNVYS